MSRAASLSKVDLSEPDYELQISGDKLFGSERWREAILYYLFGVWSNDRKVMSRPKINFGNVTFCLDPSQREYWAYGLSPDTLTSMPIVPEDQILRVSWRQTEVEQGLIRFVKDNRIKLLSIAIYDQGRLCLWKKERRGEYGCWTDAPEAPYVPT